MAGSRKAKIEELAKVIEQKKAVLKKHIEAGKAKNSAVVRVDRRLLKKAQRLRRKLVLGRKPKKEGQKEEAAPAKPAPAPKAEPAAPKQAPHAKAEAK